MTPQNASVNVNAAAIQRSRDRLNAAMLVLPGQWFALMAMFWLRFLPPFRPFGFQAPAPDLITVALACAACFLPLVLPNRWFLPNRWERRLYPHLGIRVFRYLAPDGGFVNGRLRRIDPAYRVVATRRAVRDHLAAGYTNERVHLALFLIGLCTQVFAWRTGQTIWAAVLTVMNVIFNLYPVFHQRHKRVRALRASRLW